MTLYITCNNVKQRIIVPDDTDFTLFIDTFYMEQIEWAKKNGRDISKIKKKSPQEILNSISEYENDNTREFNAYNAQPLQSVNENDERYDEGFIADYLIDDSQIVESEKKQDVIELKKRLIDGGLSEEQYQLILMYIDRQKEERIEDIADFMGISVDALNMRIQRAKRKIEKIIGKPLVF